MKMDMSFISRLMNELKRLVFSLWVLVIFLSCSSMVGAKVYKGAEIFSIESQLYGKYEFRMRAAKGSGITSTFFLWKDDSELPSIAWEEVDVEVFGKDNA